jgi:hypothetical protein
MAAVMKVDRVLNPADGAGREVYQRSGKNLAPRGRIGRSRQPRNQSTEMTADRGEQPPAGATVSGSGQCPSRLPGRGPLTIMAGLKAP